MTATLDRPPPAADRAADAARPRARRVGAWWRDTLVFAGRNIAHIRQIPEKLLDVTMQPLMFVLLFAYVFGGAIDVGGGSYREYLIGGILIQSLAFGMIGPGDRHRHRPHRRRDRPVPLAAGRRAPRTCSATTSPSSPAWRCRSSSCSAPGCSSAGARTPTSAHVPAARSSCCCVFASAMIWIGTWLGLMVRSPDAVMGVGFVVVFPLTFLSNAFVPDRVDADRAAVRSRRGTRSA